MEVFNRVIEVKSPTKPVLVDFIGDIHIGSKSCAVAKYLKAMENSKRDKSFVVIMGDVVDAIPPSDHRYDRAEVSKDEFEYNGEKWDLGSMDGAMSFVEKSLEEAAKAGRLIGVHYGNHCGKVYVQTTCNMTRMMCGRLKVKFLSYIALWNLIFKCKGKEVGRVKIFTWHGGGGASTKAGVLNLHEKLRRDFEADLYVVGHFHQLLTTHSVRLKTDGTKTQGMYTWHGCSGSFLRSYRAGTESYAEKMAYSPLSVGYIRAIIIPNKGVAELETIDMDQAE